MYIYIYIYMYIHIHTHTHTHGKNFNGGNHVKRPTKIKYSQQVVQLTV